MKIIDYVIESTNKYIEQMPKEIRKKNGQFFTSKETALFMASLFDYHHFQKKFLYSIRERVQEYLRQLLFKELLILIRLKQ